LTDLQMNLPHLFKELLLSILSLHWDVERKWNYGGIGLMSIFHLLRRQNSREQCTSVNDQHTLCNYSQAL
jgi:hypothetical protein